jgi:transposase
MLTVEKTLEDPDQYIFMAFSELPPTMCCPTPDLVKNGGRHVFYRDLPIHGKNVGIWIDRQRWMCKQCDTTVYQPVPHIHPDHKMTVRLVEYIEKRCLEETFASLSRQLGVSEGNVRLIFRNFATRELAHQKIVTPRWMGIDEVHFLSKFRGIITNVEDRTLVDLLPNRNQGAIAQYLSRLPDKEKIEIVTIDMWPPYRRAVQEILPQAKLVVDRFHISKMANEALERVRKDLRASLSRKGRLVMKNDRWLLLKNPDKLSADRIMMLEAWLANFPALRAAYHAKEAYRAIWSCGTRLEAEERYEQWKANLNPEIAPAFYDLQRAMENWHDEIFAYFDTHLTNAYTECVNGMGKILNRLGRGYSFEVIRAKMLLNYRVHKMAPKPFLRGAPVFSLNAGSPVMEEVPHTLGADISTLRREAIRTFFLP